MALADLIDNSVDARARNVLIRFFRTTDRLLSLAVVDDGEGIAEERLDQAMGFGADTGKTDDELGKYGMGLKSASFSQCRSLTVISAHTGTVAARRWTADNIRSGWICELIDTTASARHLEQDWGEVRPNGSGTLVHWDDLDAFRVAHDRADGVLEDYFRRVSLHLGLHFHRFLSDGRLRIFVDAVNDETGERGSPRIVQPLDPFGYQHTGRQGYPRAFRVDIPQVGQLNLTAHIWPRRSRHPSYILGGGKVAQRQGFYFYRNDRLIQAGGWNGWRDDAEPHSSLARVRVNLPGEYDHAFGLNVQKSAVSVPAGFLEALAAVTSDGVTFSQFVRDAIDTYRARAAYPDVGDAPLVPRNGIPRRLAAGFRRNLAGISDAPARDLSLAWRALPEDEFFDVDHDRAVLYLNSRYRRAILAGQRPGAADAPLVKTLMFLLLQDELDRRRMSRARREWLARCQSMLVAAARAQDR